MLPKVLSAGLPKLRPISKPGKDAAVTLAALSAVDVTREADSRRARQTTLYEPVVTTGDDLLSISEWPEVEMDGTPVFCVSDSERTDARTDCDAQFLMPGASIRAI